MFTLEAPFPGVQTTTVMPNPLFSDGEGHTSTVTIKRSVDGTVRTYVKSLARRRLTWQFRLAREKALELRAFYRSYFASDIRVTDHNGRVWVGSILNNPVDIENAASGRHTISDVRGEISMVQLEFEGEEQ